MSNWELESGECGHSERAEKSDQKILLRLIKIIP